MLSKNVFVYTHQCQYQVVVRVIHLTFSQTLHIAFLFFPHKSITEFFSIYFAIDDAKMLGIEGMKSTDLQN